MGRYSPALEWAKWRYVAVPNVTIQFRPTPSWAIGMGLVLFFGIVFIVRGQSEFIYFKF